MSHAVGLAAGVSPRDAPPWEDRDWLRQASDWIRREASAGGCGAVLRITSYRLGPRSALLGVDTSSGPLIFKCGLSRATTEPRLTRMLSRLFPSHIAPVVAADPARAWLLMRTVRGQSLMRGAEPADLARALEALGHIQHACAPRADELLALGCPNRTFAYISHQLGEMADSRFATHELNVELRREIAAAVPAWQRLLRDTPIGGVPDASLDNANLNPANVITTPQGAIFLDWEAGAVGHPFFTPFVLLGYMEQVMPRLARARDMLRDAYLRPWSTLLPMRELTAAFDDVAPLAAVRCAAWIVRQFDPGCEPRPGDLARARDVVAACLRTALAAVRSTR